MTRQLINALKRQKKQTKQEVLQIPGSLGITIGGQRRVEVPSRNSFVYVRLRDNQNELIQAFNNKVAPSYGLPVIVERQGNRYVVTSVDSLRYNNNYNSFAPFLPRHGNTHSFDPETGGAGDPVFVYPRQMMPALVMPSGSDGGPNAILNAYTLKNADGTWKYVGVTGTPNITQYKPTNNQAVMVLVYLDSLSGNPYLMVGSGSYFANTITGSAAVVPYIPTLIDPNHIPLAAVRLVSGTNALSWNNIYDIRQWIHTTPTGTGGGGGSGSFDDTYLRLDTANDPLTDSLLIVNNHEGNDGLYVGTVGNAYTAYLDQFTTVSGTVTAPILSIYRDVANGALIESPMIFASQAEENGLIDSDFLSYNYNGAEVFRTEKTGKLHITPPTNAGAINVEVITDAQQPLVMLHYATPSGTLQSPSMDYLRSENGGNETLDSSYLRFNQEWTLGNISNGEFLEFNSNSVKRVSINPSANGTGTMTMFDNDFSLSDGGNLLLLKTNGSPRTKIAGQGNIELGLNKTKEPNAGKIGYELFGSNYLYIVGAGTSSSDRRVQIYDKLYVSDLVQAASFNITNPAQTYNITGSPHTHPLGYQKGTEVIICPSGQGSVSATITFPVAFSAAPIVFFSAGPSVNFTTAEMPVVVRGNTLSTTQVSVFIRTTDGGAWAANRTCNLQWIAYGT